MTYPLIVLPFVVVTAVITLCTLARPRFGRRMAASGITAVVLLVLTAIFDNVMIAAGLFTYPPVHLSGLRIGAAPLEDFSYPLCAAFLLPALFTLFSRRARPGPSDLSAGRA
ncbi:lycopene cyclase domain-containing protein [Microbacterium sp. P01]|uniref:lycopene cyclase domain-containing protein n=1 Tax=unclassified Microbacterium TaxID=2609290 RepID=UPI00366FC672